MLRILVPIAPPLDKIVSPSPRCSSALQFCGERKMKYCPTCQRKFPDLMSTCPTDQSDLVQGAPPEGEAQPVVAKGGASAAPAAAKEPIDTRTLEEKLFAPLPKRAPEAPPPAP